MIKSTDTDSVNSDQIRFWNSSMGEKWVHYQQQLDACFSGINSRLLTYAHAESGEMVLDIGCGAGELALEIAQYVRSSGHVLGVDISRVLLELAIERAAKQQRQNVEFVLADAQNHAFSAGSVDLIVSRFGVMFFSDPFTAFANLRNAIKSAGRMAFVCWADVEKNLWFQIPKLAAIRQLGEIQPADPRAPGPMAFSDTRYVKEILSATGLKKIEIHEEVIPLVNVGSIDEVANLACNLGAATRIIKELDGSEEDFAIIKNEVSVAFEKFHQGSEIHVPATLNFVCCER